jgi:alpha-L-fucosidase
MKEVTMLVKPTPQQLAWQEAGLSMFLHFGINTFTDKEWGDGKEDAYVGATASSEKYSCRS